jgi:hypothetical protein
LNIDEGEGGRENIDGQDEQDGGNGVMGKENKQGRGHASLRENIDGQDKQDD